MRPLVRSVFLLALLDVTMLAAGLILVLNCDIKTEFNEIGTATAIFTLITLLTLIVFFRGRKKDPSIQTMHTLVAISIKFLCELLFAFVWFFIAKKTGLSSVILFFVLYLTFTLFSVVLMFKTLKNKSSE